MQPSTAITQPARSIRSGIVRSRLDWAIIASLLAMAAFNLIAAAGQFGTAEAHAATPACGIPLA